MKQAVLLKYCPRCRGSLYRESCGEIGCLNCGWQYHPRMGEPGGGIIRLRDLRTMEKEGHR